METSRKSADEVFLEMAFTLAQRGTCARRKVGCLLTDSRNRIIGSGYNGVSPGDRHCIATPCAGATSASGTGLELCEAIHAEQNAIAQCKTVDLVVSVYCTDSPCIHCVKMLATTGAKRIVFRREYPHAASRSYWEGRGGEWIQLLEK